MCQDVVDNARGERVAFNGSQPGNSRVCFTHVVIWSRPRVFSFAPRHYKNSLASQISCPSVFFYSISHSSINEGYCSLKIHVTAWLETSKPFRTDSTRSYTSVKDSRILSFKLMEMGSCLYFLKRWPLGKCIPWHGFAEAWQKAPDCKTVSHWFTTILAPPSPVLPLPFPLPARIQ